MTFTIEGEYNEASVKIDDLQEGAVEQVQTMVDSPAFVGDGDISIMPDAHWGSGAVIGFTMPVKNRVVPNTIGVDIGCGMFSANYGNIQIEDLEEFDAEVRDNIPVGFDVHSRNEYHMRDDFPWHECRRKIRSFTEQTDFDIDVDSVKYGLDYFTDLCGKVGYDVGRAINSVGTLGGGNHFIEFGRDSDDDLWITIHSGSRGIGASIAQYWQDKATDSMNERAMAKDIPDDIAPYLGEDWKPKASKIRADFDGEDIQQMFDDVSMFIQKTKEAESNRDTDLDYLEGEDAHGYIIDMIFAQTYASVSRREMMRSVEWALDEVEFGTQLKSRPWRYDDIESVHNYIDFMDATIRKGACRAHEGERLIVPLNMKYGTLICEGRGVDSWNNSSAHGAGRAMGRREAKRRFSDEDFGEQTDGVFMTETPLDEIPGAYKDPETIEAALGESVNVIDRIEPFMSIKAE